MFSHLPEWECPVPPWLSSPPMKLLLLTLCPQMNYGGVLQAYATQEKLRQLGHEVLLFDGLE